jgi:hypothetical protein
MLDLKGPTMTKPTDNPENSAVETTESSTTTTALAAAESALLAGYKAPVGVAAGVDFLRRAFDETAHVLNTTKGAKGSRTTDISQVLVEVDGIRRVIEVHGFESGAYKLFAEVPGKGEDAQAVAISHIFTNH